MSKRGGAWLAQSAGWGWVVAVVAVVLLTPLWLWLDPLDGFSPGRDGLTGLGERLSVVADPLANARLDLDDFGHVAESRDLTALRQTLWLPHNAHVLPLSRVWTYLWVAHAGPLERVPRALGLAALVTYGLTMLLLGHVVAWESGRPALGLAAMAGFGVSAVLEPAAHWFAASLSVMAAAAALAALAALQLWRARGGWWWVILAALATAASPWFWSGGYVAGPAGFAYLWADGRPPARRWAWVPPAASAAVFAASWAVTRGAITAAQQFHDRPMGQAFNPFQGLLSTAQGIVEVLLLGNIGLEAETAPAQAVVLVLLLVAACAMTRGRPPVASPLEAAGLVLAVLGFLLTFSARGYYGYENLRDLYWYRAIPQCGFVLFAAGWVSGRQVTGPPPRSLARPTRGGLLVVLTLVVVALVLQEPRVRARLVARSEPMTASERETFRIPVLQRLRARYLETEGVNWQRRTLAQLDRAEAIARREGLGRASIRRGVGRVLVPGLHARSTRLDGLDLLALPESGVRDDPARARALLGPLLALEPPRRPPWLPAGEPWTPPEP